MSRSNPSEQIQNPSTRWIEWDGDKGVFRYYDKVEKKRVECGFKFTFLVLDELSTVRGFNEKTNGGIYANEVKDSTKEPFVVKLFEGNEIIAEGFYRDIKDRVAAKGGSFTLNIYLAFRKEGDTQLSIGCLQLKGAALNSWIEFRKSCGRKELYEQAVKVEKFGEEVKGKITYRFPLFSLTDISPNSAAAAVELDKELQTYLKLYLSKNTVKQQTEIVKEEINKESDAAKNSDERKVRDEFNQEPEADKKKTSAYAGQAPPATPNDDLPF